MKKETKIMLDTIMVLVMNMIYLAGCFYVWSYTEAFLREVMDVTITTMVINVIIVTTFVVNTLKGILTNLKELES